MGGGAPVQGHDGLLQEDCCGGGLGVGPVQGLCCKHRAQRGRRAGACLLRPCQERLGLVRRLSGGSRVQASFLCTCMAAVWHGCCLPWLLLVSSVSGKILVIALHSADGCVVPEGHKKSGFLKKKKKKKKKK